MLILPIVNKRRVMNVQIKLKDASKELGISFKEEATFYQIDSYNDLFKFDG